MTTAGCDELCHSRSRSNLCGCLGSNKKREDDRGWNWINFRITRSRGVSDTSQQVAADHSWPIWTCATSAVDHPWCCSCWPHQQWWRIQNRSFAEMWKIGTRGPTWLPVRHHQWYIWARWWQSTRYLSKIFKHMSEIRLPIFHNFHELCTCLKKEKNENVSVCIN